MPRHALYEKRPLLLASIAAALAFFLLRDAAMPELLPLVCKGAAVGLLALYAVLLYRARDARLLAWILALAACGDVAIAFNRQIGGWLFFAAHLAALALYLRNRRDDLSAGEKAIAAGLLLLTPVAAFLLPADRGFAIQAGLYGLALGAMAASAWASSFPRYRVGLGAMLFVASDLLIFAGMGPLAGSGAAHLLVWPCYYAAQFLICAGVLQTVRRRWNPA